MAKQCEHAHRDSRFRFLVCKLLSDGKIPASGEEATRYMCSFQRFCALTQLYENTDSANGCLIKKQRRENP